MSNFPLKMNLTRNQNHHPNCNYTNNTRDATYISWAISRTLKVVVGGLERRRTRETLLASNLLSILPGCLRHCWGRGEFGGSNGLIHCLLRFYTFVVSEFIVAHERSVVLITCNHILLLSEMEVL